MKSIICWAIVWIALLFVHPRNPRSGWAYVIGIAVIAAAYIEDAISRGKPSP
jgi:hypothetical protein